MKNDIYKLSNDFFKDIPHATEKDEDIMPMEWPEEILSGKKKAILYCEKTNKDLEAKGILPFNYKIVSNEEFDKYRENYGKF